MDDTPHNLVRLTQQGRPTDPAVKEDAFRLWVAYGRSWRLVTLRTNIPETTLHRWAAAGNWEDRRRTEAAAFLPGMTTEGAIAARMAGHNAMVRLLQISQDALDGTPPNVAEVKALGIIADRGGYSPVGTKAAPQIDLDQPAEIDSDSLVGKSSDELMRLEQEYRQRKHR